MQDKDAERIANALIEEDQQAGKEIETAIHNAVDVKHWIMAVVTVLRFRPPLIKKVLEAYKWQPIEEQLVIG